MQAAFAAAYVGVSKSKFLRDKHKWPVPTRDGGNMLWYREDLDRACEEQKETGADPFASETAIDAVAG